MKMNSVLTAFVIAMTTLVSSHALASQDLISIHTYHTKDFKEGFTRSFELTSKGTLTPYEQSNRRVGCNSFESIAKSLFQRDQDFSLRVMEKRNYLSPEERNYYANSISRLDPGQIKFYTLERLFSHAEFNQFTPKQREEFIIVGKDRNTLSLKLDPELLLNSKDHFKLTEKMFAEGTLNVIDATLYTVSGQAWKPGSKIQHSLLPWQHEEVFQHKAILDRKKFPLTFEVGRAAQLDAGQVRRLFPIAVDEMKHMARILGHRPEDVTVFIHSKDNLHTKIYLRETGVKTVFANSSKNPEDVVLSGSLAEIASKFQSLDLYESVNDLSKISPRISKGQAARIIQDWRQSMFEVLDIQGPGHLQKNPLILSNEHYDQGAFLMKNFLDAGIVPHEPSAIEKVFSALAEVKVVQFDYPQGLTVDPIFQGFFELSPERALRIENIDGSFLARDSFYLERILLAVKRHYQKKIAQVKSIREVEVSISEPHFAIVTTDPHVIEKAKKLGARVVRQDVAANSNLRHAYGANNSFHFNESIPIVTKHFLYFNNSQLNRIEDSLNSVPDPYFDILKRGEWQRAFDLLNPPLQ